MARQSPCVKQFCFKNRVFFYQRKSIKHLRLKLNEKGEFHLSLPRTCPKSFVYEFLSKNEAWIEKVLSEFKEQKLLLKEDELLFLGKKYVLNLSPDFKKTQFKKDQIYSASKEEFEYFLKKTARKIFTHFIKKWEKKTGLYSTHLSIKTMKTRFGSCNSKKGYINLNLRLLEKKLYFIEYVILHEIAHLKHANHGREFYAFLEKFMPDFRARETLKFEAFLSG